MNSFQESQDTDRIIDFIESCDKLTAAEDVPAAMVEDAHDSGTSSFQGGKVSYGTSDLISTPSPGSGKKTFYCIHGKPSTRCCAVIDNTKTLDLENSLNGGHCHRSRNPEIDKKARRKLIIASVLCVIFMIGEIIGGYLSGSLAIATDAAHLLTDFASFMISLFSLWVASRPATRRMSFGWYRAEVIGALTSVLMIWVITGILVYMAIERIITKTFEIDAFIMLITSAVGVLVNIIMGLALHQHGHGHSHGGGESHSHGISNPILNVEEGLNHSEEATETITRNNNAHSSQPTKSAHKPEQNINVRAAFIHVVGDFLQSFGVFVAAMVIYYKPEWQMIDPFCTFLFSILVILTTFGIIRDTLLVLMEGSPRGIDFQEVCNTFLSLSGVIKVHNVRMWALSLDKTALAAHIVIKNGADPQTILQEATRLVHEKYNFFEMTLQIEEFIEDMEGCNQCENPPR